RAQVEVAGGASRQAEAGAAAGRAHEAGSLRRAGQERLGRSGARPLARGDARRAQQAEEKSQYHPHRSGRPRSCRGARVGRGSAAGQALSRGSWRASASRGWR
ncbi:hypothetical protein QT19_00085, partial [Staphylococcus aureus]